MCSEAATVPPLKPSFCATASSWMLPFSFAAELRGLRTGPTQTPPPSGHALNCVIETASLSRP